MDHSYQQKLAQIAIEAQTSFPLKVTQEYAQKINFNDPNDPLLKQIQPSKSELQSSEGYVTDPLKESQFTAQTGLIQKYQGRALLIVTGHCDIHCRYCFRRHFPYTENSLTPSRLAQCVKYIESDAHLHELILSGGDPLSLPNRQLKRIIHAFTHITHLKRIRIHTRTPIANHQRLDDELLNLLIQLPWRCSIVLHINHPNELDKALKQRLIQAHNKGITLLNQSVLLQGVNDHINVLTALSEVLYDAHVMPYYLHYPDPVEGSHHFHVSHADAIELHQQLKSRLSGYLVPKLVQEIPERPNKTWLPE